MYADAESSFLSPILTALRALDGRLAAATAVMRGTGTPTLERDPFRGLYVGETEIDQLLARPPGEPSFGDAREDRPLVDLAAAPRWAALVESCGLGRLELDALLLALAPELDVRYERLFAFLQDDVTRKRPTVDLALALSCASREERLAGISRFASGRPLLRDRLLDLVSDGAGPPAPRLSRQLRLDDRMVGYLFGCDEIDPRLGTAARLAPEGVRRGEDDLPETLRRRLTGLAAELSTSGAPTLLHCIGRDPGQREAAAALLASTIGRRLLVVHVGRLAALEAGVRTAVALVRREAILARGLVLWEGLDGLPPEADGRTLVDTLFDLVGTCRLPGILGTPAADDLPRAAQSLVGTAFDVPPASRGRRADYWRRHLGAHGVSVSTDDLSRLAASFPLGSGEVARAVRSARHLAAWRNPDAPRVELADLQQGARREAGSVLQHTAVRIEPRHRWDDLVLPDDAMSQLRELTHRVLHQETVFETWGFERRLSLGRGVHALFAGASGTGKTLAAEIVAGELGLPLYRIDVARVVSKYIGETEKNLQRIFAEAAIARPILFFDEADALFGKRTQVKDAHDRYANIEVSYLLQAMEQYEGLTILATNMRQNMDDAIARRLAFTVTFPLPDETQRLRLWNAAWPRETPIDTAVDTGFLARQFRLTGGNIRNVALAAAFAAAADGGVVTMAHVVRATRRELQKIGKTCVESDFGSYFPLLDAGPVGTTAA